MQLARRHKYFTRLHHAQPLRQRESDCKPLPYPSVSTILNQQLPANTNDVGLDLLEISNRRSVDLVGVRGFEPPTPTSRTWCATRLRYTP